MAEGQFSCPEQVETRGPRGTGPVGETFGADMQVFSQNDGPVTILLDTDN